MLGVTQTQKGWESRVELLPGFKFTGKMVKIMEFTGKILNSCLFVLQV
jgi:hypothetical protein